MEFIGFPKIGRLSRNCTITEKIDGTNAQIFIAPVPKPSEGDADWPSPHQPNRLAYWYGQDASMWGMWVGSRTRWITPNDDNYGFSRWIMEHLEELKSLGPGQHFGEWWGAGIQRRYGLTGNDKRFSLFNTHRWTHTAPPACCNIVPVLYEGVFTEDAVEQALSNLRDMGSHTTVNAFKPAEGIIIYHHGVKQYFKKTLDNDDEPKGVRT